ncbi:MAG TPA: ABC transporter substrate-binding protein [Gammaproteobacteria bacterium]|nr:ABC transporter substrate-binding protein [Gammaproteobacteria bacterium]
MVKVSSFFIAVILFFGSQLSFATAIGPQALVKQVAEKTIGRIKADREKIKENPKYLHVVIDELLMPHFDFERMSRWVLGKYWRKASASQKKAFVEQFKSLLVRTYASSLQEYSDELITYAPFRGNLASGDAVVRSEVAQPGGFPIPINYRLYLKNDQWLVYDISIDDVSLVANYRSSFSRQIRRGGIDNLIKKLADKNK